MVRVLITIMLQTTLLLGFAPAHAQGAQTADEWLERADAIAEKMEGYRERLQLTDEQASQVRDIFRGNVEKMRDVLEQHNVERGSELTRRQKIALAKDLRPIRQASDKKLAGILSPAQMKELEKIRAEVREERKARRKARADG